MSAPFKYGAPIIFRTPIWVPLESDQEVLVLLKPLSYGDINSIFELRYIENLDSTYTSIQTPQTVLQSAILDVKNIIGFPNLTVFINQLSISDVLHLYNKLLTLSKLGQDSVDAIEEVLELKMSSSYSDPSWSCATCQSKKLDYSRGCGYLPIDKRDPSPVLPRLRGIRPSECPMSTIDNFIVHQAITCYKLFDSGMLPEDGGLRGQTDWFVKVALIYKRKLAEAEHAAYEESKSRRK